MKTEASQKQSWKYATWEGAENLRLREGAKLPLKQKLLWLEQMTEVAKNLTRYSAKRKTSARKRK